MARNSARNRISTEINAGSMADIAFLLLIFFLVTTQIVEDKGVLVKLPPWSEDEPDITKLNKRNVYSVLVNASNQLLVRGEEMRIKELKENCINFITNPQKREDFAEEPTKAIVSLKNDRGTNYETYLSVYNELIAAYNEIRDVAANRVYGRNFNELDRDRKRDIINQYPMLLSEAEPSSFGEEK